MNARILIPVISLAFAGIIFFISYLPEYQASHHSPPEKIKNQVTKALSTATKNVHFIESSHSVGLVFEHQSKDKSLSGIADTLGSGLCVIDVDKDGFQDLFLVSGRGATRRYGLNHWWSKDVNSRLFKNISGQYFSPSAIKVESEQLITGYGCTVGDINHDGWDDILIGDIGKVHVLLNLDGKSLKHQIAPLPKTNIWPMGLTLVDVNSDGNIDILVSTLVNFENDLKVGKQQYGYQSHSFPKISNYQAQSNYALIASLANDSLSFKSLSLSGLYPSLSITPERWLGVGESNRLVFSNAEGASSGLYDIEKNRSVSSVYPWSSLSTPQITLVPETSSILIPNHSNGGIQAFTSIINDRNEAWDLGLTNDLIDAQKIWSVLAQDFNNSGRSDVVYSTGFATPAINTPARTEGSGNRFLLQQENGLYSATENAFKPELKQSNRGAVWLDFNNDGYQDLAFATNNGFSSLYINQGGSGHAISFDCSPSADCLNSKWSISYGEQAQVRRFDSPQPYLSSTSKRIHFGLNKHTDPVALTVQLKNGKNIHYDAIPIDRVYQLNLEKSTLLPVAISDKATKIRLQSVDELFQKIMLSDHSEEFEQSLLQLSWLNTQQWIVVLDLLENYKFSFSSKIKMDDTRFLRVISHALSWLHKNEVNSPDYFKLVDRVTGHLFDTEYDGFVPYLPSLLRLQSTSSYCHSMTRLAYWLEEEEVLPQTKMSLIPELFSDLATLDLNRFICTVEAISASEDPTLGRSLLGYLDSKVPPVRASVIAALGRIKYAKASNVLLEHCMSEDDIWALVECRMSLEKLKADTPVAMMPGDVNFAQYEGLHPESLLLTDQSYSYPSFSVSLDWQDYLGTTRYASIGLYGLIESYDTGMISSTDLQNILAKIDSKKLSQSLIRLSTQQTSKFETLLPFLLQHETFLSDFDLASSVLVLAKEEILRGFMERGIITVEQHGSLFFQLCMYKPSLRTFCHNTVGGDSIKLNKLNPEQMQYLLYLGNAIQKKVVIQRMIKSANDELAIDLLRSGAYLQIPLKKHALIEKILAMAFKNKIKLEASFINSLSGAEYENDLIWLRFYQEVNGNIQ